MRFVPVLLLALLGLSACATTASDPLEEERSAYGAFLAAQYAGVRLDLSQEADFYAQAQRREPAVSLLADRAFVAALLAGEMEAAADRAADSTGFGDQTRLAHIFLGADHLAQSRYADTMNVIASAPDYGPFNAFIAGVLNQWALAGRGRIDEALAEADTLSAPGFMAAHLSLHRAFLLERAGDEEGAVEAFRRVYFGSPSKRMAAEEFGAFLERAGRPDDAMDVYQAYLTLAPGEISISAALERVQTGGRAPRRPSPAQAASRVAHGPAQALAENQPGMTLTALYLRVVQRLDPDYAPARVLLGGTLQALGQTQAALNEYAAVSEGPFHPAAETEFIMLSAQLGDINGASQRAETLARAYPDDEILAIQADLYRYQGRCVEAAPLYRRSIAMGEAAGRPAVWARHLWLGACLEEAEGWPAAETALLAGLDAVPDDPELLNHLAYGWLERGLNMDEAFDMAARAATLSPESGHIIDTLGYAHYLRGEYADAVRELERAAALRPGDPTINAHLGDAYWRVGRRIEADFQWNRALQLTPGDTAAAALRDRLENGLDEPVEARAEPLAQ